MHPAEEALIRTFVQKERRPRAIFELETRNRRRKFLERLAHHYESVFEPGCLIPIPEAGADVRRLAQLLRRHGAGETCHVLSSNAAVDGQDMPLTDALLAVVGYGRPSVLICEPGPVAYFESEQEKGPPPRYLLVRDGRA